MRRLIRVFLALVIALCVLISALAEETSPTEDVTEPSTAPTEPSTQQQTKPQENSGTDNTQPDESGNTTPDPPASNPTEPTGDTTGGDTTPETAGDGGGSDAPEGGRDDDTDEGEETGGSTGESTGDDPASPGGTDTPSGTDTPGESGSSGEGGSEGGEQGGETGEASGIAAIGISAEPQEGVSLENGVLTVSEGKGASLVFSWNYGGAWDSFEIALLDGQESAVLSASRAEASYSLDAASLPEGRYGLRVEAVSDGEIVARGRYAFEIAPEASAQEDGPREGKSPGGSAPGNAGGRRSGGSSGKSGASGRGLSGGGAGSEAAQGFRVTPGEALASGHVSGTRDMRLYGAVALAASDEMICAYSLGGEAPDIVLDDGSGLFTAAIENGRLTLASDAEGTWSLSGLSLRVLARSGIGTLALQCGDSTILLDTAQPLNGSCYARLCAEGYASSDYEYAISSDGVRVTVGGDSYRLDGAELVPIKG